MGTVLFYLYRLFTILTYILSFPFTLWMRLRGSAMWINRCGQLQRNRDVDVWLHAASIGEVKVARNLVAHLIAGMPKIRLHVSVMTPMGFATATALLPKSVTLSYLMLDAPIPIRRGLNMIRPRVFAFTETEIWPNLIIELSRRGIPIILANARMSERTHRWYRLAGPMTRELFARYDRFHYRSECDSKRYESLGAPKVSGVVAGDMKFDAPPHRIEKAVLDNYARVLRGEKKARLIIAGSTRTGEDDILLDALQQIRRTWPDTRMAIAPRHIERSSEIVSLASRRGLNASLWEELKTSSDIVVINKVGMLGDLYAVCDIAFVGGTLVNIGGHNLLEPVWSGRPVLFGPHTSNVAEACQFILQSNLGCQVKDANDLTSIVCDFFAQKRSFAKPERVEPEHSATHLTGEYILSKLSND